jgi:hypothetical protein
MMRGFCAMVRLPPVMISSRNLSVAQRFFQAA